MTDIIIFWLLSKKIPKKILYITYFQRNNKSIGFGDIYMANEQYLKLLKKDFPTIKDACVEIINLKAILALPKGTEYFFSDLHGENEAFIYMLKSASGVIREKIDWLFSRSCSSAEREELSKLICYPDHVLQKKKSETGFDEWCKVVIYRLIDVCKSTSNKYTRSKVRKKLPKGFDYIMDELLHADDEDNKVYYYSEIIDSLIETQMAEQFICELSATISKLAVDRLHILGDVFDRGSHPDYIMDYLINYDNVDFQWGNHDIVWMGAAKGNWACIANVLRVSIGYNNFDMLEIGYGINLRPLAVFASEVYKDDPCICFMPHIFEQNKYDPVDIKLAAKMHKAISIIQFKVEAQLAKKYPQYRMESRIRLDKIDFSDSTVEINGRKYPLKDNFFPTIDPSDPIKLSEQEQDLMERLAASFVSSRHLKKHIDFLFSHGSLYKVYNGNLLFHGCIPMTEDGKLEKVEVNDGRWLAGKEYFDYLDKEVRKVYYCDDFSWDNGAIVWYLWSGGKSPLFGKQTITTFERLFVSDTATHREKPDPYYTHISKVETCEMILAEFGLFDTPHIVNGHVPVKTKLGESPVKGGGKLFVIDGGMAKSYYGTTGIAGYTLIFNSRYLAIAEHKPFGDGDPDSPKMQIVEYLPTRMTVGDTDTGKELKTQISDLFELVEYMQKNR
jgi:fructose-1,6-bisphosphatase-3